MNLVKVSICTRKENPYLFKKALKSSFKDWFDWRACFETQESSTIRAVLSNTSVTFSHSDELSIQEKNITDFVASAFFDFALTFLIVFFPYTLTRLWNIQTCLIQSKTALNTKILPNSILFQKRCSHYIDVIPKWTWNHDDLETVAFLLPLILLGFSRYNQTEIVFWERKK